MTSWRATWFVDIISIKYKAICCVSVYELRMGARHVSFAMCTFLYFINHQTTHQRSVVTLLRFKVIHVHLHHFYECALCLRKANINICTNMCRVRKKKVQYFIFLSLNWKWSFWAIVFSRFDRWLNEPGRLNCFMQTLPHCPEKMLNYYKIRIVSCCSFNVCPLPSVGMFDDWLWF